MAQFTVYMIETASGNYVGCTEQGLSKRMVLHRCDVRSGSKLKVHEAMRDDPEYAVHVLHEVDSKEEAWRLEIEEIETQGDLNETRGGQFDDRDAFDKGRERYAEMVAEHPELIDEQTAGAKQWRKDHPKEAYRVARRGNRVSARNKRGGVSKKTEAPINKVQKRKNHQAAAKKQHANRTPEQRAEINRKISEAHKRRKAARTPEQIAKDEAQLTEARKSIDHVYRKKKHREYFDWYRAHVRHY